MILQNIIDNIQFTNFWAALWAPALLMLLDFATGYIGACIRGEKDSAIMREGGGHKFAEFSCICVALVFDGAIATLPVKVVYIVSAYIMWMEVLSIKENVKKLLGKKAPHILDEFGDLVEKTLEDDSVLDIEHSAAEDED